MAQTSLEEMDGASSRTVQKYRDLIMIQHVICAAESNMIALKSAQCGKMMDIETQQAGAYLARTFELMNEVDALEVQKSSERKAAILTRAWQEPRTARLDSLLFESIRNIYADVSSEEKKSLFSNSVPHVNQDWAKKKDIEPEKPLTPTPTQIQRTSNRQTGTSTVARPSMGVQKGQQSKATARGKLVVPTPEDRDSRTETEEGSAPACPPYLDNPFANVQGNMQAKMPDGTNNSETLFNCMSDFPLPTMAIEYKKASHDEVQAASQCRSYLVAALKFLDLLGIREYPIFGLATNGSIGVILMGWMTQTSKVSHSCESMAETLLIVLSGQTICILDRNPKVYDIATLPGAYAYDHFVRRLKKEYMTRALDQTEKLKKGLRNVLQNNCEIVKNWTMDAQLKAIPRDASEDVRRYLDENIAQIVAKKAAKKKKSDEGEKDAN